LKKDGCWGASERPPTAFVLSPRPRRIPRLHFALAGEDSAPPFSPGRAFPDVFPPSALNLWPAWRGNPHLGGSNIRVPGPGELVSRTIRGWTPCFRPGPGCALSASRSCRLKAADGRGEGRREGSGTRAFAYRRPAWVCATRGCWTRAGGGTTKSISWHGAEIARNLGSI
jgi:hypothetical protein